MRVLHLLKAETTGGLRGIEGYRCLNATFNKIYETLLILKDYLHKESNLSSQTPNVQQQDKRTTLV